MLRWNSGSRHSVDDLPEPQHSECRTIDEIDEAAQQSTCIKDCWLIGSSGIPINVDAFAYEPIQKLLGISTTDGRVKVVGRTGCEVTLHSATVKQFGTRSLEFVVNRGAIVRICEAGVLEAWSLGGAITEEGDSCVHSLAQIKPEGDEVLCMAVMPRDPFLLLGCKSGIMRVAAFANALSVLSCDVHTASSLQLIPYRVTPDQMQASGALVMLASHSFAGIHLVLAMHELSGLVLWDMRSQKLRASLNPHAKNPLCEALKDAGRVTSCCWLSSAVGGTNGSGTSGGGRDFATGHEGGNILIWSLPKLEDYVAAEKAGSKNPPPPTVIAILRVASQNEVAEPVRSLNCVGQPQGRDALLVLGGQSEGQPDGLTLLQLSGMAKQAVAAEHGATSEPESEEDEFSPEAITRIKMPWFGTPLGYATVPKPGNMTGTEEPAALIQLLDGGRLVIHDIDGSKPTVFTMPFQSLQGVSTTGACLVPGNHPPFSQVTSLTLAAMRGVAHRCGAMEAALDLGVVAWSTGDERSEATLALSGGIPPQPNPDLAFGTVYCTGHKDGHVRTWDVFGEQPQLLFSTPHLPISSPPPSSPSQAPPPAPSSAAVTALDLAWQHGLLLTGHINGEVRLYSFNESPCQVQVAVLDSVAHPSLMQGQVLQPHKPNAPLFSNPYPPIREPPLAHEAASHWGLHDHATTLHGVMSSPSHAWTCQTAQHTAVVAGKGQQGPGWQLRLLCCLHQAEISCLTYCAANRVAAVGDKTGVVSLIDVTRALVLWSLPHMQLPVISAHTSHVRLPSRRERSLGLSPVEASMPEGVAVPSVVIASADACALVVSLESGHPIGKHGEMRPKSTAQVLLMELLDGDFSPVWMRDVLVANETIALAEEAAAIKATQKAQRRRDKQAGKVARQQSSGASSRGRDVDEHEAGENQGVGAESSGRLSDTDSDVDDCLAAAIEKMEKAKHKDRARKVLTLGVGVDRKKTNDLSLEDLAKKRSPATEGENEVDKEMEEAIQHTEQPVAEHMLLVTDTYIRIYSLRHVTLGSSCTSGNVELTTPLIFASLFQMDDAPALLTVSQQDGCEEAEFQVYAVPSLALLAQLPAQAALHGCTWKPPQGSVLKIQRILSASRLGRALLIGEDNELLQLSPVPGDIDPLVPPVQLHDWDLAAAAHAAAVAFERAELMMRCSRGGRKRRMQKELRRQQELAHAEHLKYLQEMQAVKRQRERQRKEEEEAAKASGNLQPRDSVNSQQHGEEGSIEKGVKEEQGALNEEDVDDAELPTSSCAATDADGQEQQQGIDKPEKKTGTTHKNPKGFPGLLNKMGKGISKGFTNTTRTIVALPTSVANVFQDLDTKEEDALPVAVFTEVDPEPFELYDSQYPDLKSLMSLPMPKDPRKGKGNREDDGIKPVQPKPLVPSNAGSSLLDSQLPSGATSPICAQSSVRPGSSHAENDSPRNSLDGSRAGSLRHEPGSGVSASVSLQAGRKLSGSRGKDVARRSIGEAAAQAGTHSSLDKKSSSKSSRHSGLWTSMPNFAFAGKRASEEGGDAGRDGSNDGHRSDNEHRSPSRQLSQHADDRQPSSKVKEGGLGSLFRIGSRRSEPHSVPKEPEGAHEHRDDKDSDEPLTKRLAMKLGLGVSTSHSSEYGGAVSPTSTGASEVEGGVGTTSHCLAPRSASDNQHASTLPAASGSSGGNSMFLGSRASQLPSLHLEEHAYNDDLSHYAHKHPHQAQGGAAGKGARYSGEATPSLPSKQLQEAEEDEQVDQERNSGGTARDNVDVTIRRTASDVKRKYGRRNSGDGAAGATNKSDSVGSVAFQTRSKLAERGEKLGAIEKLTLELQGGAAGFAEMAKQIAEQEKNKKWWQP